jgi:hypothetical protein
MMHVAVRWLTFLGAAALVFYFSKYEFGPRQDPRTLDGRCLYKPSAVNGILRDLEKAGRLPGYFKQETTIDLIFPMIYGLLFVTAIVGLIPGAGAPRWLVILPVLTVFADYCENATVIAMLKRYPGDLGMLPWFASAASGTKGVSLLGSTLTVVVLAVMWVVRR